MGFLSFLGRYLWRDEVYGFEGLGVDASDGHPVSVPSPMILAIEALIPHQRANTPDPSIEPPEEGRGHTEFAREAVRM